MTAEFLRSLFERRNRGVRRLDREIIRSYESVLPSAVTILTSQVLYDRFRGRVVPAIGVGAGFVIDSNSKEAIIVTNAHVAEGARGGQMQIETSGVINGKQDDKAKKSLSIDTSKIYLSPNHDIAFISVDLTKYPGLKLPKVRLSNDNLLPAGKSVLTIGAPHALEDTLSPNNYIARSNTIEATDPLGRTDKYIQLGGAINQGNSGGMTVDHSYRKPKVVGMVTLGVQGDPTTGFMLPVSIIKSEYAKYQDMRSGRRISGRSAAA
ncbi:MAG TPA: serine protease [Patescibacteria group bacterium]